MNQKLKVFFAYSHEDNNLRNRLDKHLASLRRSDFIETWFDGEIEAGKEWESKIFSELEKSDIILLLISADFIASDYCYNVEMKKAILRHDEKKSIVIPVILKHCDWHHTPFSKIQALPKNGLPVMDKKWDTEDQALMDAAIGIRTIISRIIKEREQNLTGYFEELTKLKDEKEKSENELKFLKGRLEELENQINNSSEIKLLQEMGDKNSLIQKQEKIIKELKDELNKFMSSGIETKTKTKVLKAKIIDAGEVYSSINNTDGEKWFSREIKKIAGETEWIKTSFDPKNDMIGEVVDSFMHSTQDTLIYVLKIFDKYYVPIGSDGIKMLE